MSSVSARNGTLYFDFRYRGERCREYTKLDDSLANRRKMEGVLKRIEAEIGLSIPGHAGHRFRFMPATHSDACRPPPDWSCDAG